MDELSPQLRASDADRERVAHQLQVHLGEGRLTLEEFDERVARVYAARTHGELAELTRDLPALPPELGKAPLVTPDRSPARRAARPAVPRAVWGAYLTVNLICFVIWLLTAVTGGGAYPWFLWVAGPWGAVLAGREITYRMR